MRPKASLRTPLVKLWYNRRAVLLMLNLLSFEGSRQP
jgi:hypothetical protein